MKIVSNDSLSVIDASALAGIVASMAMLLPAFVVADLAFLAVPAFALLLPSLLAGTR